MMVDSCRTLPQWLHVLDVDPVSPHESRQRSPILVSSSLNCEQWVFIPLVPETFPTQGSSAAAAEGTRAWSCPDHRHHRSHLPSSTTEQ